MHAVACTKVGNGSCVGQLPLPYNYYGSCAAQGMDKSRPSCAATTLISSYNILYAAVYYKLTSGRKTHHFTAIVANVATWLIERNFVRNFSPFFTVENISFRQYYSSG